LTLSYDAAACTGPSTGQRFPRFGVGLCEKSIYVTLSEAMHLFRVVERIDQREALKLVSEGICNDAL
jgi:hypothetical protein